MRRLLDISPAVILPIILAICLICGIAGGLAVALAPAGTNPLEALVLRVYLLQNDDELNTPLGNDPTQRRFEVQPGENANDIGIKLVTQGFISNGTLFARYAQYEDLDNDFRPGVYYLSETMDIPEIVAQLTDPTSNTVRFLIRENMRLEEIAEQIDAIEQLDMSGAEFLALVSEGALIPEDFRQRYGIPAGQSLEGFMYPATYDIPYAITASDFRTLLLNSFERNMSQEIIDAARAQGRTVYQLVIMASIIEREAVLDEERARIASVYWNRFENGQRLEADPTVEYELANQRQDGDWWPAITQANYQNVIGPYNTYVNLGLPPGPIVSPALRSIRAAAFPEDTPYFYFQTSCAGGGQHIFFETFAEHQEYFQFRVNGCQ
jgi:UPF0755 protein